MESASNTDTETPQESLFPSIEDSDIGILPPSLIELIRKALLTVVEPLPVNLCTAR